MVCKYVLLLFIVIITITFMFICQCQIISSATKTIKVTLQFDDLMNISSFENHKLVFLISSSSLYLNNLIESRTINYNRIESKIVKKLPTFNWGCAIIINHRIDHIQKGKYQHIIINIKRRDCMIPSGMLYLKNKNNQEDKRKNLPYESIQKNKDQNNNKLRIENNAKNPAPAPSNKNNNNNNDNNVADVAIVEPSKMFIYFFISFFLTVICIGYALLNMFGFPDITSSSPIKYHRTRIFKIHDDKSQKNIRKKKKSKNLKLKKKEKLKEKRRKLKLALNKDNMTKGKGVNLQALSETLSASDTKDIIESVHLLNKYLPELGKWKVVKSKPNDNNNSSSNDNNSKKMKTKSSMIALNGNILSLEESSKFAFLVKEIIEEEDL